MIDDSDDDTEGPGASNNRVSRIRFLSDGRVDFAAAHLSLGTDSDRLRTLSAKGIDLSKPALVQFNVDFRTWPPRHEALLRLAREYPSAMVCGIDDDQDGYVEFEVYAIASTELIRNIRSYVTDLLAPYRGTCSSWRIVAAVEIDGGAVNVVDLPLPLLPRF